MRDVFWAMLIVMVGTIGFVAWKTSGSGPLENADSTGQSEVVTQEAPQNTPPPSEPSPPDSISGETFNPRDLLGMHTTQAGIDIIKQNEGLRLEAYRGPGGKWLIGYGHAQGVQPGMIISQAEAEVLLRQDLVDFENGIKQKVRVAITANELSAMTSLAYNIGGSAFSASSVLKEFNAGNRAAAADAFLLWNKISSGGNLVVSDHLTERREQERALFLAR